MWPGIPHTKDTDSGQVQPKAMAGTMNHLTRILEDMTNEIERLGMTWKEKSLTIAAGPFTEYKPGDVVEFISNNGIRWTWLVVEGMEALGT